MKNAFQEVIENGVLGNFKNWKENIYWFIEMSIGTWYNNYIVSLFIKTIG